MGQWLSFYQFHDLKSAHDTEISIKVYNNNNFQSICCKNSGIKNLEITLPFIELDNVQYGRHIYMPDKKQLKYLISHKEQQQQQSKTIDGHHSSLVKTSVIEENKETVTANTASATSADGYYCSDLAKKHKDLYENVLKLQQEIHQDKTELLDHIGNQIQIKLLNEVMRRQITFSQCLYRLSEVQKHNAELMAQFFESESNQRITAPMSEFNAPELFLNNIENAKYSKFSNNNYMTSLGTNADVSDYSPAKESDRQRFKVISSNMPERQIPIIDWSSENIENEDICSVPASSSPTGLGDIAPEPLGKENFQSNNADLQIVPSISVSDEIDTFNKADSAGQKSTEMTEDLVKEHPFNDNAADDVDQNDEINFEINSTEALLDQEQMSFINEWNPEVDNRWPFSNVSSDNEGGISQRPNSRQFANDTNLMDENEISVPLDAWIKSAANAGMHENSIQNSNNIDNDLKSAKGIANITISSNKMKSDQKKRKGKRGIKC